MSKNGDALRVRHMLESAKEAVAFARGYYRADLDHDRKLMLALVRSIEVIGEAARAVSSECRRNAPDIPWKVIAGTRDRLIHGYFDVDPDVVWEIVTKHLPPLIPQLKQLLARL